MHRRIPPPLVEEPPRAIQMLEILLIRLAPPEVHVRDLEVAPEMARRVSVRIPEMVWPAILVRQPALRVVPREILRVLGDELERLGPQRRDALGRVVQVDGEAVGLVVVLHVAEDVVVDVAEEVHLGLDAPVPPCVGEGGVLVEEAAVPATHLVVGDHVAVLDLVFGQDARRFLEQVVVDPGGDGPVLVGDDFCVVVSNLVVTVGGKGRRAYQSGPQPWFRPLSFV